MITIGLQKKVKKENSIYLKALEVLKPKLKSKPISFKENKIIKEKYYSLQLTTLNNNIIHIIHNKNDVLHVIQL